MTARKVMLLGEVGVGKTSLVRRLVNDRFEADYKSTIGVDLYTWTVTNAGPDGREHVDLVIWDTDGSFNDAILRTVYVKGASGALILADASRPRTLETMTRLVEGFAAALPGRPFTLVANKCDLQPADVAIPLPARLSEWNLPILKTSALNGTNVATAFTEIASAILRRGG